MRYSRNFIFRLASLLVLLALVPATSIAGECGDLYVDSHINILDVVHLINYIYKSGPAIDPVESGDVNGDTSLNILDVVFLINYIYKGGPAPNCETLTETNYGTVEIKAICPQYDGSQITSQDFDIDIWMNFDTEEPDLCGGKIALEFYSPDGSISKISHRTFEEGFEKISTQSVDFLNDFFHLLGLFSVFTENGWGDESLPDTIAYDFAGIECIQNSLPDQAYIRFNMQVAEYGTLCVRQVNNGGDFDWLFDRLYTFDGPYCWDIGGYITFDSTPPQAIYDLNATDATSSTVELSWSAAEDGLLGSPNPTTGVAGYDIRYSTAIIDESSWDSATKATGEPAPGLPGSLETFTITGLGTDTLYYIAIKSVDSVNYRSELSNVVSIKVTDDHTDINLMDDISLPDEYILYQNNPNPFNPETKIEFNLPRASEWNLAIYNVNGQAVEIFDGFDATGRVSINWDASNFATGIYFYRLTTSDFVEIKKMVLLK